MTGNNESSSQSRVELWRTVSEAFVECAQKYPESIAVQCGDERMTYNELLRKASYVSRRLAEWGVGTGDIVLISPSRHLDTVFLIAGILLRGAIVCPLDLSGGEAKTRHILETSRARFALVTHSTPVTPDVRPLFDSFHIEMVLVDRQANHEFSSDQYQAIPDSGCYLLFTSGTTGTPKGVLMSNRGLANLIRWDICHRRCEPGVIHLQFASFHFDIAFHELFTAISSGGTAVLATSEQRRDIGLLLDLLSASRIEKAYLPYTVLNQLALASSSFTKPLYLTDITTAGEQLKINGNIRSLFKRLGAVLHNNYGSTEVQDVTSLQLDGDPDQWPDLPSIGLPIAGMQVSVLTPTGVTSDPGSKGQIVVTGPQVAMGYMQGDTDGLLPLPATSTSSANEYLTGDLGSILADGSISITGRIDRQVKVRGQQVDVAAVETAIERSRRIRQAAVVATEISGRVELIGFVTLTEESTGDILQEDVRMIVRDTLDEAAVPYRVYTVSTFPKTSTGKVDRRALEAMASSAIAVLPSPRRKQQSFEQAVSDIWNDVLPGGEGRSFSGAGGDSLSAMQLVTRLQQELQADISVADISVETTQESIVKIARSRGATSKSKLTSVPSARKDVAIIGMAGRFPGSDSVDALWRGLLRNDVLLTTSTDDPPTLAEREHFVRIGGFLDDHDHFDAEFFGISEREASLMDPQHRVFLECSWHALENAGYAPTKVPYHTGVYSASGSSTYLINCILPTVMKEDDGLFLSHRLIRDIEEILIEQGNSPEQISMRVSNKLDLTGPSVSIGSACSGALVAVHHATQAIRGGEVNMAIAGGVSICTPQNVGYFAHEGLILSPTGSCRPFDAAADGTVFGNGCAVLVLKNYDLAVRDGDQILAAIVGTAVNNDGGRKLSYTGPSLEGQVEVINAALADAGLIASDIDYVEAHGTGTPVGDSIEIAALLSTYGEPSAAEHCLVGSLKANIGHLDEAAGAAGLVKATLCVQQGKIPAIPTFQNANERVTLNGSRLKIAHGQAQNWQSRPGRPRRAAITSLGIGGTNCHIILEGRENRRDAEQDACSSLQHEIFVLSARTPEQLITLSQEMYNLVTSSSEDLSLRDVCMTSCVGRRPERYRIANAVSSKVELSRFLDDVIKGALLPSDSAGRTKIAGLFTGQGCQRTEMGTELARAFPVFKNAMEDCFKRIRISHGIDLEQVVGETPGLEPRMNLTQFAQPAIFAFEYAMTCLFRSFGVQLEQVAGHSLGEIAAWVAAGALSLDDACVLVSERGRLMGDIPAGLGVMAVAKGSAQDIALLVSNLSGDVSVAAFNSPNSIVLAGGRDVMAKLIDAGEVSGCSVTSLPVSHAFHSEQMRPIINEYTSVIARLSFSDPVIPVVSSVTGAPLLSNLDWTEYLTDHVMEPVRFDRMLQYMLEDRSTIFVELGSKPMLVGLGMENDPDAERTWIASCRSSCEVKTFLTAVAELFKRGIDIRFDDLASTKPWHRVSLPSYPFRRKRFSCSPETDSFATPTAAVGPRDQPSESRQPRGLVKSLDQTEEGVLRLIIEQIAMLLGERDVLAIDPDLEWRDLGLDSLGLIELRNRLRKSVGTSASSTVIMSSRTPRRLATEVHETASRLHTTLQDLTRNDARLLLIPGITGEPMDFAGLLPLLGDLSFEILEYPTGLDPWRNEIEPSDIIVPMTARAKEAANGNRVVLIGYSFGGKIANEVAVELHRQNVDVARVMILDIPASASPVISVSGRAAHPLDQKSFNAMISETPAKAFDALDLACATGTIDPSLKQTAAIYWANTIIAAKFEASETTIPLTFVRAGTVGVFGSQLPTEKATSVDPTWGWKKVAANVDVHVVRGDHFTIMRHDNAPQIAELIKQILYFH
ncbi:beta-ketoacyl synthase N-terminal-like domain-containing protein [Sinorhizobium sp. 7-81]|uniref:type I polyketide synthase n=1 Tax=Sinorhizobium sp. 8-89 TaxID=3049089 RepID=UPI0024C411AC|nr:type I polyketide synthase [Sinorhizobium sp. 8-89]MDK1492913.1 beta-ketoacyl synthase N-terminal-like domain-containing protein [Sinorhizobium sp. 8-89]